MSARFCLRTLALLLTLVPGTSSGDYLTTFWNRQPTPTAPTVTLASSSPTKNTAVSLTVSDCTGRVAVLVNEGAQPSAASTPWQICSTAPGAITYSLPAGEGARTLKVWAIDAWGSVSSSSGNVNMVLDTVAPSISLTALPNPMSQSSNVSIAWTVTEQTIDSSKSFLVEASQDGGTNWTTVGTVAASSGPLLNAPFSINWNVPNWTTSNAKVRVSVTDLAGNSGTTTSPTFTITTAVPNLSINTTIPTIIAGGNILSLDLTASTAIGTLSAVTLSYAADGASFTEIGSWTPGTANFTQVFPWTVPGDNVTTAKLRLSATNTYPNSASVTSSTFTIDSVAPVLQVGQFQINGGATSASSNQVKINLAATDDTTKITAFCLKNTTSGVATAPTPADSCWTQVTANPPNLTASKNLNLINFPYLIGFAAGAYNVYAWAKDEAGNISTLSNSGACTASRDCGSINFSPSPPPILNNILVANKDNPASPPEATADMTIASGESLFIKWNASGTNLITNPISLQYTTDGTTFTTISSGVANSANTGCTIDSARSGCYVWSTGVPTSTFRVRIGVTDAIGQQTFSISVPLNTNTFNLLAGNLDTGTGGAATSAVFFSNLDNDATGDIGSLVVTSSGYIFFKDALRGIMMINPQDGKLTTFLPKTGSSIDGTIGTATVSSPYRIALDAQQRLLIYDGARIRRVNLTTNTVDTMIGGGNSAADGTSALNYQIVNPGYFRGMTFTPLPNGDLWFSVGSGSTPVAGANKAVKIYKAALDQVQTFTFSGSGSYQQANAWYDGASGGSYDWFNNAAFLGLQITFNPTTSAITSAITQLRYCPYNPFCGIFNVNFDTTTGVATAPHPYPNSFWADQSHFTSMSGELYALTRGSGYNYQSANLTKYNTSTKTWTKVLGKNTIGHCVDGTAALNCDVDLQDVYVSPQGQIYFLDHGQIRTLDSSGNVLTLFGQSKSYGDGATPPSARFNKVTWIDVTNSGEIIVQDDNEFKLRSFTVGGVMNLLAGNGFQAGADLTTAANAQAYPAQYWGNTYEFIAEPSTGDIIGTRNGYFISRLSRTTGKWTDIAGAGSTDYTTADGLPGNQVCLNCSPYPDGPLGLGGGQILRAIWRWNGQQQVDRYLKQYALSDGTQTPIAGMAGLPGTDGYDWVVNEPDGTTLTAMKVTSDFGYHTKAHWEPASSKWLISTRSSNKIRTIKAGGTLGTFVTLPRGQQSFFYRVAANGQGLVYYCSGGRIYRYNMTTASETQLPWPVSTMSCTGHSLFWHSGRSSIVFPVVENRLNGVAEIKDTP